MGRCDIVSRGMSQVVDLASERKARRSSEEAFADILPLANGGIAVVTKMDETDFVWELDHAQTEIFIQALRLALKTRQSVKILQPPRKLAVRFGAF
jgi:hypothetical protein